VYIDPVTDTPRPHPPPSPGDLATSIEHSQAVGLPGQNQRACKHVVDRWGAWRVGDHGNDDAAAGIEGSGDGRRVGRRVERHRDVEHPVEEDGVVVLVFVICGHHSLVGVGEGDEGAGVAGRGGRVEAELGQVLRWVGVWRVLGRAATGDDEGRLDEVEHLVGVGVDGVGGAGEGVCFPDVDQGPGLDGLLELEMRGAGVRWGFYCTSWRASTSPMAIKTPLVAFV
jgi:hypothetical protein